MCARAAVRLASQALLPETSAIHALSPQSRGASDQALGEAVLKRNMFDAETGSLRWNVEPDPLDPSVIEPSALDENSPACDGSIRLVAALVVLQQPELSFASIVDQGQALLYKSGMRVNGRELVGIREQRVFLRGASASTCQLAMFSPPHAVSTPPAAHTEAGGNRDPRIVRRGEGSYVIARSLIEEATSGSGLTTSARAVPEPDGGLKLLSIRRGSLLEQLGLRTGDVLRSINGRELSSPDAALEAYARLRTLDRVTIGLLRAGRLQTIAYDIE